MYNIIERYMAKITKDDVNNFAKSKNCNLSNEELDFTYTFIKKNWQDIIKNPAVFDIERYKHMYSETNYKTSISRIFSKIFIFIKITI